MLASLGDEFLRAWRAGLLQPDANQPCAEVGTVAVCQLYQRAGHVDLLIGIDAIDARAFQHGQVFAFAMGCVGRLVFESIFQIAVVVVLLHGNGAGQARVVDWLARFRGGFKHGAGHHQHMIGGGVFGLEESQFNMTVAFHKR